MQTQQTDVISETRRDTSGLLPDASIAAPGDAVSEKEAAGPPVAPTRSLLSLLGSYWHAFRQWRQRERLRVSLHSLSDRELADIGLTSGDIDYVAANRAIERIRDGTAYLWPSRNAM